MRELPKSDRPRRRPPQDWSEPPHSPPNRSATLSATHPEVTPRELTWRQRLRKEWRDRVPGVQDVNTLFIPTGRHRVRLDWRHRLAIPFVVMIVVLSPLLLISGTLVWMAGRVEAAIRRARAKQGSDGA